MHSNYLVYKCDSHTVGPAQAQRLAGRHARTRVRPPRACSAVRSPTQTQRALGSRHASCGKEKQRRAAAWPSREPSRNGRLVRLRWSARWGRFHSQAATGTHTHQLMPHTASKGRWAGGSAVNECREGIVKGTGYQGSFCHQSRQAHTSPRALTAHCTSKWEERSRLVWQRAISSCGFVRCMKGSRKRRLCMGGGAGGVQGWGSLGIAGRMRTRTGR